MRNSVRLLTAVILPLAVIAIDSWLYYGLGWRYGRVIAFIFLFGPTCIGAFLIASGDWPIATKIVLIIPYFIAMIALIMFLAMYVGCAYGGECPQS